MLLEPLHELQVAEDETRRAVTDLQIASRQLQLSLGRYSHGTILLPLFPRSLRLRESAFSTATLSLENFFSRVVACLLVPLSLSLDSTFRCPLSQPHN